MSGLLRYDSDAPAYVWMGDYPTREVPKAAGLVWARIVPGRWATRDPHAAAKLAQYADATCRAQLEAVRQAEREAMQASRAKDADIEIPCPDGLAPMPFQRAGVAFMAPRRSVLLADEPGLGKTIQVLCEINRHPEWRRILVISPASIKFVWRQEAERWLTDPWQVIVGSSTDCPVTASWPEGRAVLILNYDILDRHETKLRALNWDSLIADECFPYEAKVLTDRGRLSIGTIVERRLPIRVASCDLSTGVIEWKPVVRWIKKALCVPMVTVTHATGSFTCTVDHKIWTYEHGYVEAAALHDGHTLRLVRQLGRGTEERQKHGARLRKRMRQQREVVSSALSLRSRRDYGQPAEKCREELRGASASGICGAHATKKSHVRSDQCGEDAPETVGAYFPLSWRERSDYCAARRARQSFELQPGVANPNGRCRWALPVSPTLLQSRSGLCRSKGRGRNRREDSPPEEVEIPRCEEDGGTERSRVVSVAVLERGGFEESGCGGAASAFVYDIEVACNHNYFVENVLVSNCHFLKSPTARRTMMVLGADARTIKRAQAKGSKTAEGRETIEPIPATYRRYLTGTPIPNRPLEAWPLVHSLAPHIFRTFWAYAKEFCGATQGRFGWDLTGASNLPRFNALLRANIMVRRLKSEVLTELPPLRRQVVELAVNGAERVVAAEVEAYGRHQATLEGLRAEAELAKASDDPADYKAAVAHLREAARIALAEMSKARHDTAMAKVPAVLAYLKDQVEAGAGKIVVFAHHHDVQDALMAEFGSEAVLHRGGIDDRARDAAVTRFQTDHTCRWFIGSIQAAGLGITLTASSDVRFVELSWVPSDISQAEKRLDRIGQRYSVLSQHLVLDGSLDARMAKTLIEKQDVIDKALDDREEESLPALPTEEPATASVRQAALAQEAATLTPEQIAAVHLGLRMLAGMCDGAVTRDGAGYSKTDAYIGRKLAEAAKITARQAALGRSLVRRYRRQLPTEVVSATS